MDLKPLPPELDELRSIIISSSLTSCYLLLQEVSSAKGEQLYYDKFRTRWIEIFRDIHDYVGQMKPRSFSRE